MKTIIIKTSLLLTLLASGNLSFAASKSFQQEWQGTVVYSAFRTMGSGVPLSPCHVLTNVHVVRGSNFAKVSISGKLRRATVVATDESNDMALLKVANCPIEHHARLSPIAPKKGEILTSNYYKPGLNLFRHMTRSSGKLMGIQSVVTEENRRMSSLAIDDPHPYLRASGGGVSSKHGLVSIIFGFANRPGGRKTYAVSYHALKTFLQQNHLYSSGSTR